MPNVKGIEGEKNTAAIKKVEKRLNASMGIQGSKWVGSGTAKHLGDWYAIQGIDSAIIDMGGSDFDPQVAQVDSAVDLVIPNGAIVYLRATGIALVSGKAILYKYANRDNI